MLIWLLACAPSSPPPAPAAPQPITVQLDYGPLYGGFSSMGMVDSRLAEPALVDRVQLEAGALSSMREDGSVEPWLLRVLLSPLSERGSTIIGPEGTGATLWLRDLHFGVGTDTVNVVVRPDADQGDRYAIGIRQYGDEESLCPDILTVEVPYIGLHATVQRASDGAVVAIWHEVILPELDPERAVREATIPPEQLCETIGDLTARDPALQPTDEEYLRAAKDLVRFALLPFDAPQP